MSYVPVRRSESTPLVSFLVDTVPCKTIGRMSESANKGECNSPVSLADLDSVAKRRCPAGKGAPVGASHGVGSL